MQTVTIIVDETTYSGAAELSTTLFEFLSGRGRQAEELLFENCGKPVSTRYTLVHSVSGKTFTAAGRVSEDVPALTLEEVVATTV